MAQVSPHGRHGLAGIRWIMEDMRRRGCQRTATRPRRGMLMMAILGVAACGSLPELGRPDLDTVAGRMPEEIAGFVRGDVVQRPGNTLSVDYATANRSAVGTVLVYETGGRPAPSDPASAEIDRAVTTAVSEVTEVPHGRTGRRLTERERVTIADPGLRCALLDGYFGRAPVRRHICVGGAGGRFVKIQVTTSATRGPGPDAVAFASGALRAVRGM